MSKVVRSVERGTEVRLLNHAKTDYPARYHNRHGIVVGFNKKRMPLVAYAGRSNPIAIAKTKLEVVR